MNPVAPEAVSLFRNSLDIPDHYWQDLEAIDPTEVGQRTLASFQPEKGYLVPFLNQVYVCQPWSKRIRRMDLPEKELNFQTYLVLLMYLIKAQDIPLDGKKVSEKILPGGYLFFRGPHALLKEPLEKKFGKDPEGFLRAGLELGGRETELGDASFELLVLPRIPVEYIIYEEDEEFPPQLVIHFDSSISRHLPLDVIWAMINLTSHRLASDHKKEI
jgi:Domain of unknown function (DUF3786)